MTELTIDNLQNLEAEAQGTLAAVSTRAELEEWRVSYVGRRGAIPQLLRSVKDLSHDERKKVGAYGNELRERLEASFEQKEAELQEGREVLEEQSEAFDSIGHLHPLTLTSRRLMEIFSDLGFVYVEGPLAEEPQYNFDLLNIPFEHPARAETDTFYLDTGAVLRTHVSTLQTRATREQGMRPPLKFFYLGRTFRAEKADATHESTFNQFEFMVVSPDASLGQLKWLVQEVYGRFFGTDVSVRLRPAYFPFVEPGLEVDMSCVFCKQRGCRVCKRTGWIEMAGAGMVHPIVLANMNVDPDAYRGFALGGAVDRLAMLRHNVPDIRDFWSGDILFLRQFS